MYSGASIVCSQDFWDSMTPDQQTAFTKAAAEAGAYFRENMREETQTILKEGNFEVSEITTDSQFYKDLKAAAVKLWGQYANEYDPAIIEKINADFSA